MSNFNVGDRVVLTEMSLGVPAGFRGEVLVIESMHCDQRGEQRDMAEVKGLLPNDAQLYDLLVWADCLELVPSEWPALKVGDWVVRGPDWNPTWDTWDKRRYGPGPWRVVSIGKDQSTGVVVRVGIALSFTSDGGFQYRAGCHHVQLAPEREQHRCATVDELREYDRQCNEQASTPTCPCGQPLQHMQQLRGLWCPQCRRVDTLLPPEPCRHPADRILPLHYTPGRGECMVCHQEVDTPPQVISTDCMTDSDHE